MSEQDIQIELDRIFSLKNEADLDEAMIDFVLNKLGWSEEIINTFYDEFSRNPMMFKNAKKFIVQVL
ncbi:hypothetical protein [Photobacterium damselae]|uniref:hypothetical protein n=1 Tax=Photobacterium damselae TaxID=38293 RepID=UPI0011D0B468|nr:hypothetical protein [Photobacterium damselae]KAB1505962.1 hypothetical protein FD717_017785 [Photobacterium damselae subsp. damselae]